jgi:hypothetical protein
MTLEIKTESSFVLSAENDLSIKRPRRLLMIRVKEFPVIYLNVVLKRQLGMLYNLYQAGLSHVL